jgi:hypothetical protein
MQGDKPQGVGATKDNEPQQIIVTHDNEQMQTNKQEIKHDVNFTIL